MTASRIANVVLLSLAALGMLRGSLDGKPSGNRQPSGGFHHGALVGSTPTPSTLRPALWDALPWVPAPEHISRVLAPGETVRVLSRDQWRAIRDAFPAEQEYTAARAGWCEGHLDPATAIIDVDGLPRYGAWQVGSTWWGPVPDNLAGQAHQVAGIVAEHGWTPFAGAGGCKEWNR